MRSFVPLTLALGSAITVSAAVQHYSSARYVAPYRTALHTEYEAPDLSPLLHVPPPPVTEKSGNTIKLDSKELECLRKNIYFEAGVESHTGKIAVAQVTFSRLKSGRWGSTVCEVVHARKQFSWTLFANKRNETPRGPLWEYSLIATEAFLKGERVSSIGDSMFYHTKQVSPSWAKQMKKIVDIGNHEFYNHRS